MRARIVLALTLIPLAACSSSTQTPSTPVSLTPSSSTSATSSTASSTSPAADDRNLESATKVGQEFVDRFTSGDFGGAWDLMSADGQAIVSREDSIKLDAECQGEGGSGMPIKVVGVRMDGEDKALVRLELMGVKSSRTMVYEDGWRMTPSPAYAAQKGKPWKDILAERVANGECPAKSS